MGVFSSLPNVGSQRRALGPVRCTDWFGSVGDGPKGRARKSWSGNEVTIASGRWVMVWSTVLALRIAGSMLATVSWWKSDKRFLTRSPAVGPFLILSFDDDRCSALLNEAIHFVLLRPTVNGQRRASAPVRCDDWFDSVRRSTSDGAANSWIGNEVTMMMCDGMRCPARNPLRRFACLIRAIIFEWKWDADFRVMTTGRRALLFSGRLHFGFADSTP